MNAPKIFNRASLFVGALFLSGAVAAFFAFQESSGPTPAPVSYLVGEMVKESLVASRKITVVDHVETDVQRENQSGKVPLVFRFNPNVSDQTVGKLSTEFVFAREKFLDAIEASFKTRTLTTNDFSKPRFNTAYKSLLETAAFPVSKELAKAWALGDAKEEYLKELSRQLRLTTDQFIRLETLPALPKGGAPQLRVLSATELDPSAELLKQLSRLVRRTNTIMLWKARNNLLGSFPREERIVAKFLTNLVTANCIFDATLTGKMQAERTNAIWVVLSYDAGQVVVKAGEKVNAKTKAVLDELRIFKPSVPAPRLKQILLWALAGLCGISAIAIGIGSFVRSGRNSSGPSNVLVLPGQQVNDDLRASLIPHLARGLMNRLVRGLIAQRSELIRTQETGTEQLADLEQRLDQINNRLQTRQAVSELRIAELEKELAAAEEENRELIRAKIREARQNLEWAKSEQASRQQ